MYVDLSKLVYLRLLGGGKVTHPLFVKVACHSKSAEGKIEDTNGKILEGT
ncbi:MAG: uL15m family ribosomal protein [Candidatus Bathyarchaeia archaeon]